MRNVITVLAIVAVASPAHSGPATRPATRPVATWKLPPAIAQFRERVKDMGAKEVLAAADAQFGKPTRDSGSGLHIPQWDVAGGTLTVHPLTGPTFKPRAGPTVWLLPTVNPVGENVARSFEMATLPDPKNHGNTFWIGNVSIAGDGAYAFVDGGSNLRARGDQSGNFFVNHPKGRVEIAWRKGVDADTPLESADDGEVAQLTFSAEGGREPFRCALRSSSTERALEMKGPTFAMGAGWLHHWPRNRGPADEK